MQFYWLAKSVLGSKLLYIQDTLDQIKVCNNHKQASCQIELWFGTYLKLAISDISIRWKVVCGSVSSFCCINSLLDQFTHKIDEEARLTVLQIFYWDNFACHVFALQSWSTFVNKVDLSNYFLVAFRPVDLDYAPDQLVACNSLNSVFFWDSVNFFGLFWFLRIFCESHCLISLGFTDQIRRLYYWGNIFFS